MINLPPLPMAVEDTARNKCTVLKGKWEKEGRRTHKRGDGGERGEG